MSAVIRMLERIHLRREKIDALDHLIGWRRNDPFCEIIRQRLDKLPEDLLMQDPNAALQLITFQERQAHPYLYARHRVLEFLERFA